MTLHAQDKKLPKSARSAATSFVHEDAGCNLPPRRGGGARRRVACWCLGAIWAGRLMLNRHYLRAKRSRSSEALLPWGKAAEGLSGWSEVTYLMSK